MVCPPKILPLKSVTLEKLEQMEKEMERQKTDLMRAAQEQREGDSMVRRAAAASSGGNPDVYRL